MFSYAVIITILIVIITVQLGKLLERAKRGIAEEKKETDFTQASE